jgi:hypothetical protein
VLDEVVSQVILRILEVLVAKDLPREGADDLHVLLRHASHLTAPALAPSADAERTAVANGGLGHCLAYAGEPPQRRV